MARVDARSRSHKTAKRYIVMNTSPNDSSADTFWNRRYKDEGVLWGETHSPTAGIAKRHFLQGSRILEIGFGYGRDLIFLAKEGFKMTGVEPSHEGLSMAKTRLADSGINVEQMLNGEFETTQLPPAGFDGVLSHRFLHLLTTPEMVDSFLKRLLYVTCPEAIICIGARNLTDRNRPLSGAIAPQDRTLGAGERRAPSTGLALGHRHRKL